MEKLTEEQLVELIEAAEEEGCEWGEAIPRLCDLYDSAQYLSDDFYKACTKELQLQYDFMKKNTEVVIKEETVTRRHKVILWRD